MSAELLRRAAVALRQHAEKATIGPWVAHSDGLVWAGPPGDPVSGSEQVADAEYIALLGPPVALALADLLVSPVVLSEIESGEPCPECVHSDCVSHRRIMAIARAILREPEAGDVR